MTKIDWNREENFTDAEFDALERYENGDLKVTDFAFHVLFMTEDQRDRLSDDDWSRAIEADEEMRCLHAEAAIEFGVA